MTENTPVYGYKAFLPAIGAFLGGITFPTTALFGDFLNTLPIGGSAVVLGCALGAMLGDLVLHLMARETVMGKGMFMKFIYTALAAGLFGIVGVFVAYLLNATGTGLIAAEYLIPLVSAVGVYMYGSRIAGF